MQVTDYELFMDLDFHKLQFKGRLFVNLKTEEDVVLNSVGLDIQRVIWDERNFSFMQRGDDLIINTGPFDGILELDYEGSITDSLVGIYRAPFDHTHIVTTHFEAAQARRMLPCVDRPNAKAEFKLTVKIDDDLDVISNMPVESVSVDRNWKTVKFQKTPRMSTYLLYLGVGKFDEQTEKLDRTDIIVASTPGKVKMGTFAQEEAKKAMAFYNSYYGIPYSLPKIHLIAVPEFAMGAMENWGAITFRESALLVDANSSTRSRRRVAEIVDHELAHQWFGNLVTMKWWDDIWLNESFATLMAFKVVDSIHPEWRVWEDFLRSEMAGALARDCLKNTHPIQVPVKSPDEIEQIFDSISYGKGASILRMIEAYVGAEAFQKGIQHYLSSHMFSNATGNDLWNALEVTSRKPVQMIMSEWVRRPGYPVVTVEVRGEELILHQERFLISGSSEKALWPIPVTMEVNGEPRSVLMDKEEVTIGVKGIKSLKINPDRSGFYLVQYLGCEDLLWKSKLSAIDRWGIVSDAYAFLLSGKIRFADYMMFLKRFIDDREYLPTHEVSDQLSILYTIAPSSVSDFSRTFHSLQFDALRQKTDENSLILRGTVASRLTLVDDAFASELAPEFNEYELVPPDMKSAVALAYARSTANYDSLLNAYRKTNSDEDKVRLLNAMTAFTDESLVNRTLNFAFGGEVKRQDVRNVILAATEKPDAKNVTWTWLQDNIERLRELYQSTGILSGTLLSIIPILGIGRIEETEQFFNEHKMPGADVGIHAGLEKLRAYDKLARSAT